MNDLLIGVLFAAGMAILLIFVTIRIAYFLADIRSNIRMKELRKRYEESVKDKVYYEVDENGNVKRFVRYD